ncbi:MAG: helix-turn-helix transcriptional regulator [Bacteroidetes bacterium]|nr:helix-turn-helix transcriptional regulator [Bacteroidota bacterium]
MSIGAKIKEARAKKKLSLQAVADEIGVSKTHIWDLETGRSTNPSVELITKLASFYRLKIADLVGENPESETEDGEIVAMYRDLKVLEFEDRETIKLLMERLKKLNSTR